MEEEKVTTDKPKNPGREEWGRKLGKLAKQKKIQIQPNESTNTVAYNNYYIYGLAIAGVIIGVGVYKFRTKPQVTSFKIDNPKERTFCDF